MIFTVDSIIYVDDLAVTFTTRDQLCMGVPLLQSIFDDLGLKMHIGKRVKITNEDGQKEEMTKASKTKCIFFCKTTPFQTTSGRSRQIYNSFDIRGRSEQFWREKRRKIQAWRENLQQMQRNTKCKNKEQVVRTHEFTQTLDSRRVTFLRCL